MALVFSVSSPFCSIKNAHQPQIGALQALPRARTHKTKQRFMMNLQANKELLDSDILITKQSPNIYKPTLWSYDFLQSLKDDPIDQVLKDKAKKMEEDVRSMITNEKVKILTRLELIDDIQRLGLGYKYEDEIRKALSRCVSWVRDNDERKKSLDATALGFRLLRQHGYDVSQDIFKSFMDLPEACLTTDVKGMLSLYEASYFAFEGEHLLDEARAFTRKHLSHLKEGSASESLAEHVSHALELPLHHRMPRLEARWYIEAYGKRSDANKVLLEHAKLDFNMVQSTLQSDIKEMSRYVHYKGKITITYWYLVFYGIDGLVPPQLLIPYKNLVYIIKKKNAWKPFFET